MNYLRIYQELISDAQRNPKTEWYKEKHHIIPLCLGGTNNKDNIVRLTAKQHFIAHWLLYKEYRTPKLAYAWYSMCRIGIGQDQRSINSRYFKLAKENRARVLSENSKGSNNNFFGKTHSKKTRETLSRKAKQRGKIWSESGRLNWINRVAKKNNSELQKEIAASQFKGKVVLQNILTKEIICIPKHQLQEYDKTEWMHPRKITPEARNKCLYCNVVTTNANLKRWHMEKCKEFKCE